MKRFISFLVFILPLVFLYQFVFGATYYVDCNANGDAGAGTSTDLAVAWKTIAKVNGSSFSAGDSILFNKGCTWREQLTVPSSGSAGSPITFGAYGTGANPIISGNTILTSWTSESGFATPALVQATNLSQTTGSTIVKAFATNNTAGNMIMACAEETLSSTAVTFSFSDSQNNTYHYLGNSQNSDVSHYFRCAYAYNINSGSNTVTVTFNATPVRSALVIAEYSGLVSASDPLDVYSQAIGNPGPANSGSNTTTIATELIAAVDWMSGTSETGPGSGFTTASNTSTNETVWAEYKIVTSTGSYNATWQSTSSQNWMATMGAFKANSNATIYYKTLASSPTQVFEDGLRYTKVDSKAALVVKSWWWDSVNTRVYIMTSGNNDPSNYTMEYSTVNYNILINSGINYITIKDLALTGAALHGVYLLGPCNHNILSGLNITNSYLNGIKTGAGNNNNNNVIQNNSISWNGAAGIYLGSGSNNWNVSYNSIYNNCQIPSDDNNDHRWSGGIYVGVDDVSPRITDIVVEYNTIYNNGQLPNGDYVPYQVIGSDTVIIGKGIWFDTEHGIGYSDNNIIRYNLVYGNNFVNIHAEHNTYTQCYYNIVYGGDAAIKVTGSYAPIGIEFGDFSHEAGDNNAYNTVYNNTIYDFPNSAGIYLTGGNGGVANTCINNLVKNNIVFNSKYALWAENGCENDGTNGTGNVYIYNNWGTPATNWLWWGTNKYSTLNAWVTASDQVNNLASDPLFVSTTNFHLKGSSPARRAGTNVGLTTDYAGRPVLNPPCIGAYEYGGGRKPMRINGKWR
jgi:hypothetical protein